MANETTQLTLNGTTIHSLQELRDNFKAEELMKHYLDGTLLAWLESHYYEAEASILGKVRFEMSANIEKICDVLKIDYDPYANLSDEEKARWDERRRIIEEACPDTTILSKIHLVAMNQEELAQLLKQEIRNIYLCKEHFSIPISLPGIKYTCIGNAVIDDAYTAEQYKRAGITVTGFDLPKEENPDTAELAKEAAIVNGYDAYYENHSYLGCIFHDRLKSDKLINWHHVPYDSSVAGKFFKSKSECKAARESTIRKAYSEAEKFLSTDNSKSLAKEAATRYSEHIASVFGNNNRHILEVLSSHTNASLYAMLCEKIDNCYKNLLAEFKNEITENSDYYSLYNIEYFIEAVEIEEHDYRVEEDFIARALETLFTDSIEYTITDLYSSIGEIEQDLDVYANTFFGAAYDIYRDYVAEIEDIIEQIGQCLPAHNEGEELEDYIARCCVQTS